jgi:hypothetical protein
VNGEWPWYLGWIITTAIFILSWGLGLMLVTNLAAVLAAVYLIASVRDSA